MPILLIFVGIVFISELRKC